MAFFWADRSTHKVPMTLHATNRRRLVERLRAHGVAAGTVVLQGAPSTNRFDTDHELWTRQESFFQWAFGVKEPDCFGSIDVATGDSTLFIPRLPDSYAVWMGRIRRPHEFVTAYEVTSCRYTDEIAASLAPASRLLLLKGLNTDSGSFAVPATFAGVEALEADTATLFPHIVELRLIKTEAELEVLRYVAGVSCAAHKHVMAAVHPGMLEYQAEALFRYHCHYEGGCRQQVDCFPLPPPNPFGLPLMTTSGVFVHLCVRPQCRHASLRPRCRSQRPQDAERGGRAVRHGRRGEGAVADARGLRGGTDKPD